MNSQCRVAQYVFVLYVLYFIPGASVAALKCHLHALSLADPEFAKQLLAFARSEDDCHQENIRQFAGQGWCHCSFGNLLGRPPSFESNSGSPNNGPDRLMR